MAPSPSAQQQRARIIRDLTQDRVRTRGTNSDAGSNVERDSAYDTVSSFDPEHEALNSTRHMDNSIQQALPNIRTTNRDNGRNPYLDDGYHINMPAPERVLRDQDGSSESSMSIELGRGNRRSSRKSSNKSLPSEDPTENIIFDMGDGSLWELTATPPGKPRPGAKARYIGEIAGARKDGQEKQKSTVPSAEERVSSAPLGGQSLGTSQSNATRKPSSLAHMHARVTDEDDGSYIGDERPQQSTTLTKSTRFGSIRNNPAPTNAIPTKFSADNGLGGKASREGTPKRALQDGSTNPQVVPGTGTVQSFVLPDIPNITELVSGARADGTPIFSRTNKARSRFASGSNRTTPRSSKSVHIPVDGIPLPEEEKAIFASLQLLQEKVTQLELEKDEKDQKIGQYENEIIELRAQAEAQKEIRRSDSGLGTTDDEARGPSNWKIDRAKLETSVKSFQSRLDKAEQRASISDISIKRITQERDNLVTQLGVAYVNIEELKRDSESIEAQNKFLEKENDILMRENDAFRAENQALRDQLAKLMGQYEEETQNWTKKEEKLRFRIQKRDDAVKEAREMTRELLSTRNETQDLLTAKGQKKQSLAQNVRRASARVEKDTQTKISDRIEQELRRTRSDGGSRPMLASPTKRGTNNAHFAEDTSSKSRGLKDTSNGNVGLTDDMLDDSASEVESTTDLDMVKQSRAQDKALVNPTKGQNLTLDSGKDVTFQSFTEGEEIARLREALQEERQVLREARAIAAQYPEEPTKATRSMGDGEKTNTQGVRRKSSMKDATRTSGPDATTRSVRESTMADNKSAHAQQLDDEATTGSRRRRPSSSTHAGKQPQDNTVNSATSRTSRRHRSGDIEDFEEMTSAFILPDITLHPKKTTTATATGERPTLSTEAKEVLHSLAPHDPASCTICPQIFSAKTADAKAAAGTTAAVATFNPIPVSQRPSVNNNNEDATIRPTQPPRQALLAALQRTEDEVAHTKLALRDAEAAYAQLDPSLGRRKRHALARKIEGLVRSVERRSDVVYALYDVLEGLKGSEGIADGVVGDEDDETGGLIGADGASLGATKGIKNLDETLQSVGIDPRNELGEAVKQAVAGVVGDAAGRGKEEKTKAKVKKSVGFGMSGGLPDGFYSDEDDDDELPWEGIVTDGESLASGRAGRSRRNSEY